MSLHKSGACKRRMKLQKDLETARSDPKQRKLNFGTGIGAQQL